MYGKVFASMFNGSMHGAGPVVFAVWTYAIANAVNEQVELNPAALAPILGCPAEQIEAAIAYLEAPDPKSRSEAEDGRRLIREGRFAYHLVNHRRYREIISEDGRRAYMREYMRRRRAKQAATPTTASKQPANRKQPLAKVTHTEAEAEAYSLTHTGGGSSPLAGPRRCTVAQAVEWFSDPSLEPKPVPAYTEREIKAAWHSLQANGWRWGKGTVTDPFSALASRIEDARERAGTKGKHHESKPAVRPPGRNSSLQDPSQYK